MINLGRNSGKGMPNVHLNPALIDFIIEGLSILLGIVACVITIIYYPKLSVKLSQFWLFPLFVMLLTVLFLWLSRAPIRFYNFPVKLTEQNYVRQYWIASRLTRTIGLILNLLMLFSVLMETKAVLGQSPTVFFIMFKVSIVLIFLALGVYYYFALRNR